MYLDTLQHCEIKRDERTFTSTSAQIDAFKYRKTHVAFKQTSLVSSISCKFIYLQIRRININAYINLLSISDTLIMLNVLNSSERSVLKSRQDCIYNTKYSECRIQLNPDTK